MGMDLAARPLVPGAVLRQQLAWGAAGALLAGGLTIAALSLELVRGARPGLSLSSWLGLVTILPEVFVLLAFRRLADAIGREGLGRAALGVFAVGWVLDVLLLIKDAGLDEGLLVLVGLAVVALILTRIALALWFAVALLRCRA